MKKTMLCVIGGLILISFSGVAQPYRNQEKGLEDLAAYICGLADRGIKQLDKDIAITKVDIVIKKAVLSTLKESPALKDDKKELVQVVNSKVISELGGLKGNNGTNQLGWMPMTSMYCNHCQQTENFEARIVNWWTREASWFCTVCNNEYDK